MTRVEELAAFVTRARFEDVSDAAREQLKVRIIDALGCAIGAVEGGPVRLLREHVAEFSPAGACTLIGGGTAAPEAAALYNGALVRYLDFNDSYLAKGETCHPSDTLGAVLAAADYAGADGCTLLTALAVSYQVQCRLSDEAPVRARGFDHTVQGAYGAAAGISKALGLDAAQTANAIAISGTALNALRVTRTGVLSNWKGHAMPFTASQALTAALLARRGISGPRGVFEGNKGFIETVAGTFHLDWSREDLERVTRTILKRYNAEIHSQATLEGIFDLMATHSFQPAQIERVEIETFDVAYHIIGGGEEGSKREVRTKEEADHSLLYMVAVALLDGEVMPPQYVPERIGRADVQSLLQRVRVTPRADFSAAFPERMPCRVTIRLAGGETLAVEKEDYEGFHTRPMSRDTVTRKFDALAAPHADSATRQTILETVANLETLPVAVLTEALAGVRKG